MRNCTISEKSHADPSADHPWILLKWRTFDSARNNTFSESAFAWRNKKHTVYNFVIFNHVNDRPFWFGRIDGFEVIQRPMIGPGPTSNMDLVSRKIPRFFRSQPALRGFAAIARNDCKFCAIGQNVADYYFRHIVEGTDPLTRLVWSLDVKVSRGWDRGLQYWRLIMKRLTIPLELDVVLNWWISPLPPILIIK